eukprot:CAMPEP_0174963638 /NCGR_PEP_ID=MMETSP0004_2-20121128/5439_1 /TAXON_ID=420556 /ORGANISM="Ochromonas sp., Strain CCMP1393" /LENGTH=414 /DNA_ID=CAMNT_0016212281 /DNA_START=37 /DNA_END=1281 /DNA_ORIENTATION=+
MGVMGQTWSERIVQVLYDDKKLKYFNTSLELKGSMDLTPDLKTRLVPPEESDGKPNCFEIESAGEKIIFFSIMPNGANKWYNFLKDFNRNCDLRTIKAEKEKLIQWVDETVGAVMSQYGGNTIALRLNLEELLTNNQTLTKNIDASLMINMEDVDEEFSDATGDVHNHYTKSVQDQLDIIKNQSMSVCKSILQLLVQLYEEAVFFASTVTTASSSSLVLASEPNSEKVFLGVPMTGPIFAGNGEALGNWLKSLSAHTHTIAAHFLSGKSFNERQFADFLALVEKVGSAASGAPEIGKLITQVKSVAAGAPISLSDADSASLLKELQGTLGSLYAVKLVVALCNQCAPSKWSSAPCCALKPAALWTVDAAASSAAVAATAGAGSFAQVVRVAQVLEEEEAVDADVDAAAAGVGSI